MTLEVVQGTRLSSPNAWRVARREPAGCSSAAVNCQPTTSKAPIRRPALTCALRMMRSFMRKVIEFRCELYRFFLEMQQKTETLAQLGYRQHHDRAIRERHEEL